MGSEEVGVARCDYIMCEKDCTHAVIQGKEEKPTVLGFYCQEHAYDMIGFLRKMTEDETARIVTLEELGLRRTVFELRKETSDE